MQIRDFLTMKTTAAILAVLGRTRERRWGHVFGSYSINALQLALRFAGHDLINLIKLSREMEGLKKFLFEKVSPSERHRPMIIGLPPGQSNGFYHAVSRVYINGTYRIINSDHYGPVKSTEAALKKFLRRIDMVYCIEERQPFNG
ncbi:hypothetical protein L917_08630 [Phytophthora nicotianae]|uniref:Uncharacterized protein n=5 Tax=Phytophthora nicotianae TaxID=4792 RepID=V9F576_PHYNI|nr:hypothetical protein F443_08960 [Phytophthora nicotianae P1569]ETK86592.1 hypothetical protein L915_08784 [Phytophthora nicotianae]ETL93131.1 hypothetical protein L917_08630 [Phytophthora nicotianae]